VVAVADMLHGLQADPRGREYADIIRSSAATLERVVSDVLDFSKIEAGQIGIEVQPFVLQDLVESVTKPFAVLARAKSVSLETEVADDLAPTYLGDPHRISQVLNNLVGNAVKFTSRGRIDVRVRRRGDEVVFCVTDTGVGFSADVRERLFGRFMQADTSITRRYGGSGLGLAICSALVKLMDGRIDATSRPGEGSMFEVALPLQAVAIDLSARSPVEAPAADKRTDLSPDVPADRRMVVLLAEDNPTNQRVVEVILQGADIDLVVAENGVQALEAFRERQFDCILMDMQMPEMDGIQATREIRTIEAQTGRPRTPIICVSANAMAEHVAASRPAGADSHLAKPFRAQALLDARIGQLAA
jgi:CheY-like chemotaxis protein/anti-sigma regulatory factor (Ser/Thr protein kinase)